MTARPRETYYNPKNLVATLLQEEDIGVRAVGLNGTVEVNSNHTLGVGIHHDGSVEGGVVDNHHLVLCVVDDDPSTLNLVVRQHDTVAREVAIGASATRGDALGNCIRAEGHLQDVGVLGGNAEADREVTCLSTRYPVTRQTDDLVVFDTRLTLLELDGVHLNGNVQCGVDGNGGAAQSKCASLIEQRRGAVENVLQLCFCL